MSRAGQLLNKINEVYINRDKFYVVREDDYYNVADQYDDKASADEGAKKMNKKGRTEWVVVKGDYLSQLRDDQDNGRLD